MRTEIVSPFKETAAGAIAEEVLRGCVHCGLCNAACPTFRLTGDELDGPRGRIWLMKRALEGEFAGALTQRHLDRCLECRACETACPSGVEYHRLLDATRPLTTAKVPRQDASRRSMLRFVAARPGLLSLLMGLGRAVRPILAKRLVEHLPAPKTPGPWPRTRHSRRMLILGGCVQQAAASRFNAATARVFDQLGISLVERAGCCGAVPAHLDSPAEAKAHARRQIEAWEKALSSGYEAVVVNASGCAAFARDWPDLFADEPAWAEKARRVIADLKDPIEVVREGEFSPRRAPAAARIAVHDPCTLRNGPGLGGEVERLLARLGYEPQPVADPWQCCGSAGAYSLLQPDLSEKLREQRLAALNAGAPEAIYTANIGCWMHMAAVSPVPVRHWIEAVDDLFSQGALGVVPTPSPPAAPVRAAASPVQASPRPKARASAKPPAAPAKAKAAVKPPAAPAKAEAKPVPAAPAAKVNAKAAAKTNAPPAPPPAAPVKSKASPVQASAPPKAKAAVKPPAAPAKGKASSAQSSPPPKAKASAKPPAAPAKAAVKPPAAPAKAMTKPAQAAPAPKANAAAKLAAPPPPAPAKSKAKASPTLAALAPKVTAVRASGARASTPAKGAKKGPARPK